MDLGIFDDLRAFMNKYCIFTESTLDHHNTLRVLYQATEELRRHIPNEGFPEAVMQLAKLAVPSTDGTPWLLRTAQDVKARLKPLFVEMKQSKMFLLAHRPEKRQLAVKRGSGKAKAKAAKANTKAKAEPRPRSSGRPDEVGVSETVMFSNSEGVREERPTTFLDDLVNTIEHAIQGAVKMNMEYVREAILLGMIFATTGKVEVVECLDSAPKKKARPTNAAGLPSQVFESYSPFRKWLVKWLTSKHEYPHGKQPAVDGPEDTENVEADLGSAAGSAEEWRFESKLARPDSRQSHQHVTSEREG